LAKKPSNLECERQGGQISAVLYGDDGLPGYPESDSYVGLGQATLRPFLANPVLHNVKLT
jgi:hypothetical protein